MLTLLCLISQEKMLALSKAENPGEILLHAFGEKLCTVTTLEVILRKCELYDVLLLISMPG